MNINRRWFMGGAVGLLAMPAIVRAESLMKIAVLRQSLPTGLVSSADDAFRDVARSVAMFNGQTFFLADDGFYSFNPTTGLHPLGL